MWLVLVLVLMSTEKGWMMDTSPSAAYTQIRYLSRLTKSNPSINQRQIQSRASTRGAQVDRLNHNAPQHLGNIGFPFMSISPKFPPEKKSQQPQSLSAQQSSHAFNEPKLLKSFAPFNDTIKDECLELIINKICKFKYYTSEIEYHDRLIDGMRFQCVGEEGCHPANLEKEYCNNPGPYTDRLPSPALSYPCNGISNKNNYCARITACDLPPRCKRKLMCLCGICIPAGRPKHRYEDHHSQLFSPALRALRLHVLRSQLSRSRKEKVLQRLQSVAFRNLVQPKSQPDIIPSRRLNANYAY